MSPPNLYTGIWIHCMSTRLRSGPFVLGCFHCKSILIWVTSLLQYLHFVCMIFFQSDYSLWMLLWVHSCGFMLKSASSPESVEIMHLWAQNHIIIMTLYRQSFRYFGYMFVHISKSNSRPFEHSWVICQLFMTEFPSSLW